MLPKTNPGRPNSDLQENELQELTMGRVAILGAGGTIGAALARRLTDGGTPLLLVGRPSARLTAMCSGNGPARAALRFSDIAVAGRRAEVRCHRRTAAVRNRQLHRLRPAQTSPLDI
ncbi:MAG UNVERIFIED_CONTAM: hypothetical protein LVR18_49435 [Planctomycetaceae bacterium]|jgi:NAD(P)-dependent dehydrogenase (short-subunit alcohol dehydrogenase family)